MSLSALFQRRAHVSVFERWERDTDPWGYHLHLYWHQWGVEGETHFHWGASSFHETAWSKTTWFPTHLIPMAALEQMGTILRKDICLHLLKGKFICSPFSNSIKSAKAGFSVMLLNPLASLCQAPGTISRKLRFSHTSPALTSTVLRAGTSVQPSFI